MSRFLVVALLACCAAVPPPTPDATADVRTVDGWLDRWSETRRCLVADADDVKTGVAVTFLLGQNCEALLHELMEPQSREPLARAPKLIEAIWQHPSVVAKRAAGIEAVDKLARDLARSVGRDVSPPMAQPLKVLGAPQRLFESSLAGSFAGGLARGFELHEEVVIEQIGHPRTYSDDPGPKATVRDGPGRHLANAETEHQRIVVWSAADHAYEVDVSADGGAHWTTAVGPEGSTYLRGWQDPRTRAIEISLREADGKIKIHRITAQHPSPVVRDADGVTSVGARGCAHGGNHWSLIDGQVDRFGATPLRLPRYDALGELDCRGDAALVTSHWPDVVQRCRARCDVVLNSPHTFEGRAALLDDGRWIYAAMIDQVVGVWTEGRPEPEFFRLATSGQLSAIVVFGGKPALVLDTGKAYEAVTL